MQSSPAARARITAITLGFAVAGLALAGCARVDEALFGQQAAAPSASTAPAPQTPAAPETAPAVAAEQNPPAESAPATPAPELGITLATIEPTTSTGTAVGQTIDRLRGELSELHDKAAADLQQLGTLKNAGAQNTTTYQEAKSHVIIRLQIGTTKGNPELVGQWNTSQSALDALTANINSLAALGTALSTDAGRAQTERATISDTFNMAGAVDADHRQLTVLQQETGGLVTALEQMQRSVTQSIQRETAFVANERGSLTTLASAIKSGELYPTTEMPSSATASLNPSAVSTEPANAIVTIKFDQKKVDFEQELYTALNQALQSKPSASFRVVAVSPTQGSATAVQTAQKDAHRHAQDVLKSMTAMGVPAARVAMSSSTDPSVSASEVRVYVR